MFARDPQGNLPANHQPASLSVRIPRVSHWLIVAFWVTAIGAGLAGWVASYLLVRLLLRFG
jgi:hypothetical protein